MTIAFISHPLCALHDAGFSHPERPERVSVIESAVKQYAFKSPIKFYEAIPASHHQLLSVHDESYVNWVMSIAPAEGTIGIDADTWMNPHTLTAARLAAGAVILAVDLVMKGKAQAAFCNVRPPGHHAEREKAMGFCFFNNVAIGAMHALTEYELQRVAIIDFDVHHGNGTQSIFQKDKRVLYCSCFEHPFYPGYESEMDNEHILCVPLAAGTSSDVFRASVQKVWFDQLLAFKPQLIFFSAGFDAHLYDALSDLQLVEADYVWLTTEIAKMAKVVCEGKMVSVLEGGYSLEALAECVPPHIDAMVLQEGDK